MAWLLALPVELVLSIIGNLDSPVDLAAFSQTCRALYQMTEETYWDTIEDQVFCNETLRNPSFELLALADMRHLKASKTKKELRDIDPFTDGVPRRQNFSELVELRKTVRWFMGEFFKNRFEIEGLESPPSNAKIIDIENAFCIIWLWIEGSFDLANRWNFDTIIDWAIADDREEFDRKYKVRQPGGLGHVYCFLMQSLTHVGPLLAKNRRNVEAELLACSSAQFAQYFRFGIPSILLIEKGINGMKSFLGSSLEDQVKEAAPYFDHAKNGVRTPRSILYYARDPAAYHFSDQLHRLLSGG
ncbi:hypothetical protein TWF718_009847 [Orbilia javanica]|uniref:F-box domain-containing protein n=1 Tax=Orbilia javanica TaxID=47235 RepID=A0AAN8RAU3_9PEZI